MYRLTVLVILSGPLLVTADVKPDSAAIIRFSFYAPPQKAPPVHIVGFENDRSEVYPVLENTSDKTVVAVLVGIEHIVPAGCSLDANRGSVGFGGAGFRLRIPAHHNAIATRAGIFLPEGGKPEPPASPQYPTWMVFDARRAAAAYMQVQFGVTGVYFEDGSTWPEQIATGYPLDPFDPSLVAAEAGKCSDVPAVVNALKLVKEVIFDHERPTISDQADEKTLPPHLRFSCSLEGPKAVCRLPLEQDQSTKKPESETSKQK